MSSNPARSHQQLKFQVAIFAIVSVAYPQWLQQTAVRQVIGTVTQLAYSRKRDGHFMWAFPVDQQR
ncbi:MAG TPA: hypothetical protein VNH18_23140 [Bryobacteraceae bacterium]|jgi:hypothetical protein|nr:hypothetical protein [Bryobacteraceae bacterium]HXJ42193.1 hypothetical protein [Bryobacteraceae bacterium]